jgi:Putative peptidoglycan binding domain
MAGPRYSGATQYRNPTYANNPGRFNAANRTTAYNTRNYTGPRNAGGTRGAYNRSVAASGERIVGRHNGNWNRSWNRNHDHYWNGHRCHWHNNAWVLYAPYFWYPYYGYGYGYDYYPYYDGGYSEQTYVPQEYSQDYPQEDSKSTNSNHYQNQDDAQYDGSRITEVQRALAREGYYDGAVDGTMGPGTRRALRRYQSNHGLDATGAIDQAVIEALHLR